MHLLITWHSQCIKSLLMLNENENVNRSEDGVPVALIGEINFDQRSPAWNGEL